MRRPTVMPCRGGIKDLTRPVVSTERFQAVIVTTQQRLSDFPMRARSLWPSRFKHRAEGSVDLAKVMQRREEHESGAERLGQWWSQDLRNSGDVEHMQDG